ncbi:hypothetical protein RRG08_002340 [Elysia crispata]|uniref:Uncharacterized protein n=1 Tax=Elysia crispata TaxID=231223 RepID=A0AAE1DE63_9GAST|nr:hypothetical protein RRG08_002340 [Elysia crispata]
MRSEKVDGLCVCWRSGRALRANISDVGNSHYGATSADQEDVFVAY